MHPPERPAMETSAIASVATALSNTRVSNEASLLVLKKALDSQAQSAAQLVAALPEPPRSNPPNLGNQVDLFA